MISKPMVKGLHGGSVDVSPRGKLAERFTLVPFSVLSARDGWWQDRKRAWVALGIQSELGRGEALISKGGLYAGDDPKYGNRGPKVNKVSPGGSPRPAMKVGKDGKTQRGDGAGRPLYATDPGALTFNIRADAYRKPRTEGQIKGGLTHGLTCNAYRTPGAECTTATGTGTSIFDPVLCEAVYRWWCPRGGQVNDPFAGGSVRGIVAGVLGHPYWGCDLSEPQIEANRRQGETIPVVVKPTWVCGDSLVEVSSAPAADFIVGCPPYGSLEVYSDDPRDVSNMTDDLFDRTYTSIINRMCKRLRQDRFAVFVVGDYRDQYGCYRDLPGLTTAAFKAAGLRLYNEAVLVTAAGSLPIRASAQFEKSRKLGKTHQNVLVYVKGDPKRAAEACGRKP